MFPIKIFKKCMAAKLFDTAVRSTAHANARIFRAKPLNEIPSIIGHVRSEFLDGTKTQQSKRMDKDTTDAPLQCLHVICDCKRPQGSGLEMECDLHDTVTLSECVRKQCAPLSISYSKMPTAHQSADDP